MQEEFHATEDRNEVRSEVFDFISRNEGIRADATLLEKSKAQPHIRSSNDAFYKYAWFHHFKRL